MVTSILLTINHWFVLCCVLIGGAYAALLYYREKRFEFSSSLRTLLAVFRTLVVAFIAYQLFSPFFRVTKHITSKPVVVFAQDNSMSIRAGADSSYYLNRYREDVGRLIETLSEKYEVLTYTFGQEFKSSRTFDFTEKQTNISEAISEIQARMVNRNAGAMILASDGLFNRGLHPYYAVPHLAFPMFTIALGDTTPKRDLLVYRVLNNRIAYLNNTFPVEIQLRGILCKDQRTVVSISHKGRILHREPVVIDSDNFNKTISVGIIAVEPGLQRYTIFVQPIEGEISQINNQRDIFIDVVEGKNKVLLLYHAPHPDIGALRNALESHPNYEVTVMEASKLQSRPDAYSLVILHQVPSRKQNYASLLKQINDQQVPVIYMLGSLSSVENFNQLKTGLTIHEAGTCSEILPVLNVTYSAFSLGPEFREIVRFYPPLCSPSGTYKLGGPVSVLFYQQVGSLTTELPLVITSNFNGYKSGVVAGEGIWRWRMATFARTGSHHLFDELAVKLVQYLSLREEKSRFRVITQAVWNENDPVELIAETYNESYEPVIDMEVEITISDENNNQYPYSFSPGNKTYFLNAGILSPGNYTYRASARKGSEVLQTRGSFSVLPVQSEMITTTADHMLLRGLAERFGGKLFYPQDMGKIPETLQAMGSLKPLIHSEMKYVEFIDITWLLIPLLLLLLLEWLMRRLSGGY